MGDSSNWIGNVELGITISKEQATKEFLSYFKENAYLIKDSYRPRIDYLKIIDNLIGGK